MGIFYVLVAALTLFALAFLLWPMIVTSPDPLSAQAQKLRDKLSTLERAEADGLIEAAVASERREELKNALLTLIASPRAPVQRPLLAIALVSLLLPISALALYRSFGKPFAIEYAKVDQARASQSQAESSQGEPSAQGSDNSAQKGPDLREAVQGLAERLKDKPDDVEGQLLLARTWRELQEFANARDAYALVYARKKDDAEVIAEYAEMAGLAQNPRSLVGEPTQLLDEALKIDPANTRALWLRGFAHRQAGQPKDALERWDRALKVMPPDSPVAGALIQQINEVRGELGMALLPVSAPAASSAGTGLPENDGTLAAPDQTASASAASAQDSSDAASAGAAIRVRIKISDQVKAKMAASDVLFVFARADAGPPMPLAIQRFQAASFPLETSLSDANAMAEGKKLSLLPKVKIGARLSKSGQAMAQPGDLQGFSAVVTQPVSGVVEVTIDSVVE
jgi:cytochrome c-type biogenesis protein CcmH